MDFAEILTQSCLGDHVSYDSTMSKIGQYMSENRWKTWVHYNIRRARYMYSRAKGTPKCVELNFVWNSTRLQGQWDFFFFLTDVLKSIAAIRALKSCKQTYKTPCHVLQWEKYTKVRRAQFCVELDKASRSVGSSIFDWWFKDKCYFIPWLWTLMETLTPFTSFLSLKRNFFQRRYLATLNQSAGIINAVYNVDTCAGRIFWFWGTGIC
jgi:hypothetical protein